MKIKITAYLVFLFCSYSYAQINEYTYKRELNGVSKQWHKVVLTEEIFGKVSPTFNDIRIFSITKQKDTIEAPYFMQLQTEKIITSEVNFKLLNTSYNKKGYYFTLEVPTNEAINQLKLNFKQQNFDWKLTLEGSNNQKEWFTVVNDYRILSIKNSETNYQFTNIVFPNTKYQFFRILIKSNEKPTLSIAKIASNSSTKGSYNNYVIEKFIIIDKKNLKETELEIKLTAKVPVSSVKINLNETFDYYRPLTIKYLADSLETELGWKYIYKTLTSGTLNSIEKNEFKFQSTLLQKLKINISNYDNEPLLIDSVQVNGYVHELIARFTKPATYYLTYGNKEAVKPNYDIKRFVSKIPDTLAVLNLGKELLIDKEKVIGKEPLFKNKNWLWTVMAIIILLLGWFSIKMMKSK
ncbi:MAG: DUF3999 family protein [Lutibacter sp.]|uniref:DUF3999 family protein n=1 Tax=Lutibacter sp. TaxID=1925666 RepID=UPI0019D89101|nr:DUF3999 family protein [Lutibacter sp.]NOR29300.1 DUF3999 family protein [Lutibacter sp.]